MLDEEDIELILVCFRLAITDECQASAPRCRFHEAASPRPRSVDDIWAFGRAASRFTLLSLASRAITLRAWPLLAFPRFLHLTPRFSWRPLRRYFSPVYNIEALARLRCRDYAAHYDGRRLHASAHIYLPRRIFTRFICRVVLAEPHGHAGPSSLFSDSARGARLTP